MERREAYSPEVRMSGTRAKKTALEKKEARFPDPKSTHAEAAPAAMKGRRKPTMAGWLTWDLR